MNGDESRLTGIGAAVFAYLALIPFMLLGSTFDNSLLEPRTARRPCPSRWSCFALYSACLLALAGTALLFADHAVRGRGPSRSTGSRSRCASALAVVGITLFTLFCLVSPIGGAVATVVGILTWRLLGRHNRSGPRMPGGGDPRAAELRRAPAPAGEPEPELAGPRGRGVSLRRGKCRHLCMQEAHK